MSRLRTTLVAVGLGTAVIAGGTAIAGNATATPAPVAAVAEVGSGPTTPIGAIKTATDSTGSPTAAGTAPRGVGRAWWNRLTDEQRTCLAGAELTRPVGPLDDAERAALRTKIQAAATTCEITLPLGRARAFWNDLTDVQRTCLKDAAVTRPWGPLTKEQRKEVRADLKAAAQKCGVAVPTKAPATL